MISEQLSGMSLHPGSARLSAPGSGSGSGSASGSTSVPVPPRLDRTISTTSKIEEEEQEEQSDFLFSMEEEDGKDGNKRNDPSWDRDETKETSNDA